MKNHIKQLTGRDLKCIKKLPSIKKYLSSVNKTTADGDELKVIYFFFMSRKNFVSKNHIVNISGNFIGLISRISWV